jgi:hypothetical protein
MMRRVLLVLGMLVGVLLIAGVVGWLWVDYQTSPKSWPTEEFSSAAWKAAAPEERYVFYRDLADSGQIEEFTKEGLIELLGEPSWEDPAGTCMTYVVKEREPEEWSLNAIYLLDIRLDPDTGKVRRYFIRGD